MSDNLLDLVAPKWEEFGWEGMPPYEHKDLQPARSLTVHFANDADIAAFAKLVGQKIGEKTRSIWYPEAEIGRFAEKIYRAAEPRNPRYPVYIISKGRWEKRLTARAFEALGVPYRIVVEPQEHELYASVVAPEKILTLPFSNLGLGSIPARNWVWEHSISEGTKRHWIVDDNIDGFFYYQNNLKTPVGDGTIFAAMEDYTDRYDNVALAGPNYFMFVSRKSGNIPPVTMNTRIYSCILIDNKLSYRWRGRYNEDTDLSIRALKDGMVTMLFNAFLGLKQTTMTMKGGNTDELYVDQGRLLMAQSLVEQHPDVVVVSEKWGRPQHHVDYSGFKLNRPILRPDASNLDFDNTLSLGRRERTDPTDRLNISTIGPQAPVILVPRADAPRAEAQPARAAATRASVPPEATPIPPVRAAPRAPAVAFATPAASVEWVDPFLAEYAATLDFAGDSQVGFGEWESAAVPTGLDVEVFSNFFVACFSRFDDGGRVAFEMSHRSELDREGLAAALRAARPLVTFNGAAYDLPIIALALSGADPARLKAASDRIVRGDLRPWDVERELGVRIPAVDHVDLMETNPSVRQGLKVLAGRLNCRVLVDLPFDPETVLSPHQMNVVTLYCVESDLVATRTLWEALREPLALRAVMSRTYGIDLRSKSDAQVGEAVIRKRVENAIGRRISRPVAAPSVFRYVPPDFIRFRADNLSGLLDRIRGGEFLSDGAGKITPPDALRDAVVHIGTGSYKLGIGGLHSHEAQRSLYSDDYQTLIDIDLSSQYPNILRNLRVYPPALGPAFLDVYGATIDARIAAKLAGNIVEADSGKIQLNGIGGKLNSATSVFYSPETFIAMTLTGQLSILTFIERAEILGISVVSANTDGVTLQCPRDKEAALNELIGTWESETNFQFERVRYRSLHSASVNTYLAIREDGKLKRKGLLADPWADGDLRGQMSKNPQMTILGEAVLALVRDGTPIAETIASSNDPRKFVTVINVRGGGVWRRVRLGRVVRYFWSTNGAPITYVTNGNRVPKTEGASPLVKLADSLPPDLDHARYIREAEKLAKDVGFLLDEEGLLQ